MLRFSISILFCCNMVQADVLDSVWAALYRKQAATQSYLSKIPEAIALRKEIVATQQTFSLSPQILSTPESAPFGEFSARQNFSYSNPSWNFNGSLQEDHEGLQSGNVNLFYTVASSLQSKLQILGDSYSLELSKSKLLWEQQLFTNLKSILQNRLQLFFLQKEQENKRKGNVLVSDLLNKITGIVKEGLIPSNSVQSLELLLLDNKLQLQSLGLEEKLLLQKMEIDYALSQKDFNNLPIVKILTSIAYEKNISSYSWRRDSLQRVTLELQKKEQNQKDWKLSIGAVSYVTDVEDLRFSQNGVGIQFQYNFHNGESTKTSPLPREPKILHSSTLTLDLDTYAKQAKLLSEDTYASTEKILERLRLGESSGIFELAENVRRILSQKSQYYILRQRYLSQKMSLFVALEQLPLSWRTRL